MSNNPILPVVPEGSAPIDDGPLGEEEELQESRNDLDDGESQDSQDTVDEDLREGDDVNANIED
jgi:hypothetical protein